MGSINLGLLGIGVWMIGDGIGGVPQAPGILKIIGGVICIVGAFIA